MCIQGWIRGTRYLCAILLLLLVSPLAKAAVVDDFGDGAWNADGHWDASNITQGSLPVPPDYNEELVPGCLSIVFMDWGSPKTTMVLRDDQSLQVGQWVRLNVAISDKQQDPIVRIGLGLASSRGRKGYDKKEGDRANVLYWGLRNPGIVRGHAYGAKGVECATAEAHIKDYEPGSFQTLAIRRVAEDRFELYQAKMGQTLQLVSSIQWPQGPGNIPPAIPGLMFDSAAGAKATLVVDNFEIGSAWPPASEGTAHPVLPLLPVPAAPPLPEGQVALVLPDDIMQLPKLPSTRHLVFMPKGNGDNTYHHGAIIEHWKGKLYLAWHTSLENEFTLDHDGSGLLSSSTNGETWSSPIPFDTVPRGFNATDDKLYMWGERRIFFTVDGTSWQEIPRERLGGIPNDILQTSSNRVFGHLRDGRLMAYGLGSGGAQFPITSDPTGLSGWTINSIDRNTCPDTGEPGGYEGPDGVLHGVIRYGFFVWHTYSRDGGKTWDKLREQTRFSDCPSNKQFGVLPDKSVWYIGNPVILNRQWLVLGHSRDGWTFDNNYLVRWESVKPIWSSERKNEDPGAGYEYPAAVYHDGYMYVAYSVCRDFIEVSKVDASSLLNQHGKLAK